MLDCCKDCIFHEQDCLFNAMKHNDGYCNHYVQRKKKNIVRIILEHVRIISVVILILGLIAATLFISYSLTHDMLSDVAGHEVKPSTTIWYMLHKK